MPLRVVTIDDEPPALKRMRDMLSREDVEIVAEYDDPRYAITDMPDIAPDLVFLDIQMPGMSGFDVANAIQMDSQLITFVTAFDEFAVRAFDQHAFDYLLKPVDQARLHDSITRAVERLSRDSRAESHARLTAVLEQVGVMSNASSADVDSFPRVASQVERPSQTGGSGRISLTVDKAVHVVSPSDIDRVEAQGNYIRVFIGKRELLVREPLANLQARLPASEFLRIRRSTLVNVARVRELQPWMNSDYLVVLQDGTKVATGRTYRDDVRQAFGIA